MINAVPGKDPEFGKGDTRNDSLQGNPRYGPISNLGMTGKGPFYAMHCWPASVGTAAGLLTDDQGRVLDGSGNPIGGLYARAFDIYATFCRFHPCGDGAIGPAMTFRYLAAKNMIGESGRNLA